ncbi:tRNA1(Val) (adenine(37)-N6)-methyltransferase [Phaeovulum sp.]|uniref:tRNA1(Val) (adenine(37)-N6)-methyltransferase n=1 Tax=Phaeovulum sp. TaxID=2934796 RepID=UPI0039E2A89C
MFAPEDLTQDGFLGGHLIVAQPRNGYRAAMDPVLLAAACPAYAGQSVLELGCGAGVASLCLGWRVPGLRLAGLEVQPSYAVLARDNAARNGIMLEVFEGDLAAPPPDLRAQNFDHVIANPPYFAPCDGTSAADAGRELARRELTPLDQWVRQALRRLHPGGQITLIQQADRLADVLCALAGRAGSTQVLPIAPRQGRAAGRVIVQARKGGRGVLRLLAPLVLHAAPAHIRDGEDMTPEVRKILRNGAPLVLDH